MDEARDLPDDSGQGDAEEQLKNHVICVCEKRQLRTFTAIGAVLLLAVVVVGAICGSGACASSSSSSNTASSRENDFGGSMPTSSIMQNMTAPFATPVAASPTNAPTFVKPSPTMPPSASVTTPAPIQNAGPIPTSPPTRMPVASPPTVVSSTMQLIRNAGVLRYGVYDVTWSGDNNDAAFSIDLVR
jgi:hypothetical protein